MTPIEVLFPLIFLVLTGYLCGKTGFIATTQLEGLRRFIFYIAIPVFLFLNMYQADLDKVASPQLLLAFYIPVLMCYLLTLTTKWLNNKKARAEAAMWGLGGTYSNTVLVGLPVIIAALGSEAGSLVFMIITFHSALLFALSFLFSSNRSGSLIETLKPLFVNPIVLSISAGLLFNALYIPLPKLLFSGLEWLAKPAISGALFVLGVSLVQYSIKQAWKRALLLSITKLWVLPIMVFGFANWLQLSEIHTAVLTLMAASPLGVNAYLVARQQQCAQDTLAASVVISTMLSPFSISAWLYLLI
ncbi:AEC family transporter [Pseudoalteromonas luteoviolacea]|uniref:AEC family transporter n=1 Tax=Pseudoalteromonas luteoviolacea TaxID=43657 RepID=UPI001B37F1B9|nr:AEC family transporter [Pseudoalteromonas luteoviolacea]MBQ4812152.1 AEC family transporter [Pseudoalteromonas luteoviolacea]